MLILFPGLWQDFSLAEPTVTKDQIRAIEKKLSKEKRKLQVVGSHEEDILSELSDLEQEVALKRRAVHRMAEKIRQARAEIDKQRKRLASIERSFRDVERQVATRLVALYKHGRQGYLKVIADARDLNQFWRQAKYLKAIMEEDRRALKRLAGQAKRNREEISRIKADIADKEAIRREERLRLSALRKDLEEKVIQLMKIHKEKEFYQTAVDELQVAAENLKKALLHIEKKTVYRSRVSARFSDFLGKLPLPVEGKVIRAEKLMRSAKKKSCKGVFIAGAPGAKVRAVFPGRVGFSGKIKGYGEVIIINHGSRYFTISARLAKREKREGDLVYDGDVIGQAGTDGVSEGSRIYFEIRRAGKNLDPMKWLKIR